MSKRAKRIARDDGQDGPGWLTTFNDLVTLLMVFFVLLFTMGTMDTQKLKEFQYALQSGLGILETGSQVSIAVTDSGQDPERTHLLSQDGGTEPPVHDRQDTDRMDETLETFTAEPGINVRYSDQGAHITFEDHMLFSFGKADINPAGLAFLDKVAALLQKVPYPVRVEGHTDNVPIRTVRFPSNWELSIARAVSVVKYLAGRGRINPQRLSAVGYGDTRPLAPNDLPAGRSKNRRVEMVLATEG